MQNEDGLSSEKNSPSENKNETISELAHRHLRDKNHITTDEELKNARVEFSDESDALDEDDERMFKADNTTLTSDSKGDDKVTNNASDDDTAPNPYDVLSS